MNFVDHGDLTLDTSCNAKKKRKTCSLKSSPNVRIEKQFFFLRDPTKKNWRGEGASYQDDVTHHGQQKQMSPPVCHRARQPHSHTHSQQALRTSESTREFLLRCPHFSIVKHNPPPISQWLLKKGNVSCFVWLSLFSIDQVRDERKRTKSDYSPITSTDFFFSCEEQRVGVSIAL